MMGSIIEYNIKFDISGYSFDIERVRVYSSGIVAGYLQFAMDVGVVNNFFRDNDNDLTKYRVVFNRDNDMGIQPEVVIAKIRNMIEKFIKSIGLNVEFEVVGGSSRQNRYSHM